MMLQIISSILYEQPAWRTTPNISNKVKNEINITPDIWIFGIKRNKEPKLGGKDLTTQNTYNRFANTWRKIK